MTQLIIWSPLSFHYYSYHTELYFYFQVCKGGWWKPTGTFHITLLWPVFHPPPSLKLKPHLPCERVICASFFGDHLSFFPHAFLQTYSHCTQENEVITPLDSFSVLLLLLGRMCLHWNPQLSLGYHMWYGKSWAMLVSTVVNLSAFWVLILPLVSLQVCTL